MYVHIAKDGNGYVIKDDDELKKWLVDGSLAAGDKVYSVLEEFAVKGKLELVVKK